MVAGERVRVGPAAIRAKDLRVSEGANTQWLRRDRTASARKARSRQRHRRERGDSGECHGGSLFSRRRLVLRQVTSTRRWLDVGRDVRRVTVKRWLVGQRLVRIGSPALFQNLMD
jgi:hypothetical protein